MLDNPGCEQTELYRVAATISALTVASHVEGDTVVITVADTGSGIPDDIAERVAPPLSR